MLELMDEFDFSTLSDDPELAFVELERHFRRQLHETLNDSQSGDYSDTLYIEYVNHTIAAAKALRLEFLNDWSVPSHQTRRVHDFYKDFSTAVSGITLQINISRARHHKEYSVAFASADKEKIRHYVGKIKTVIDTATISVEKKDSLHKKLNRFLAEVDQIRTSLESFGDLATGLAHIGGDIARELEPARKWLDTIARLFGYYRDMEDAQRVLQAPKERLRIEPPKLRLPPPDQSFDFDDDIPF